MRGKQVRQEITILALLLLTMGAGAAAQEKVTYDDQVRPIFASRCLTCHNPDKLKGGLDLSTYPSVIKGGGSGDVVIPGDPDSSRMYRLLTHQEEPFMPPQSDILPKKSLDLVKRWIQDGLLENAGSSAKKSKKPKTSVALGQIATRAADAPLPMPDHWRLQPFIVTKRAAAVASIAANPFSPLVAITGQKQVLLYNAQTLELEGIVPFSDGQPFFVTFSSDGGLLVVAGGHSALKGKVHLFDVVSGERLSEIGDESDVVLAADLSADRRFVALGGPAKAVRIHATADGSLVHTIKKHTDWVTAVDYSPDGVLLATADRAGNLHVWETATRQEFYTLPGHTAAITSVSWRPDSNVLASASEDGTVRLWEMMSGQLVKSWQAHGGGVQSVSFSREGRLVTTGRDRNVSIWNAEGNLERVATTMNEMAMEAVFSADGTRVLAGDFAGDVRVVQCADGKDLGLVPGNPPSIESRLEALAQRLAENDAERLAREAALSAAEETGRGPLDQLATAKVEVDRQTAVVREVEAEVAALDGELARLEQERAVALAEALQLSAQREQAVGAAVRAKEADAIARLAGEQITENTASRAKVNEALQALQASAALSPADAELAQALAQCSAAIASLDQALEKAKQRKTENEALAQQLTTQSSPQVVESFEAGIQTANQRAADLETRKNATAEQKPALAARLEEARSALAPIEQKKNEQLVIAEPFEQQVATARASLDEVRASRRGLEQETARWRAELINVEAWKLKEELREKKLVVLEKEAALEEAGALLKTKEQELEAARDNEAQLPARIAQKETELEVPLKALEDARAACDGARAMLEEKAAFAGALKEQADRTQERASKEPGNAALQGAAQKLSETIALLDQDVAAAQGILDQRSQEVDTAQKSLDAARAEIEHLLKAKEEAPAVIAAAVAALKDANSVLAGCASEKQQADRVAQDLEQRIAGTRALYLSSLPQGS